MTMKHCHQQQQPDSLTSNTIAAKSNKAALDLKSGTGKGKYSTMPIPLTSPGIPSANRNQGLSSAQRLGRAVKTLKYLDKLRLCGRML